jgi:hypothetical protein
VFWWSHLATKECWPKLLVGYSTVKFLFWTAINFGCEYNWMSACKSLKEVIKSREKDSKSIHVLKYNMKQGSLDEYWRVLWVKISVCKQEKDHGERHVILFFIFYFLFFDYYFLVVLGLNSGPHACYTGALPLEKLLQPYHCS